MTDRDSIVLERKMTWGGLLTIATILITAGIQWGVTQTALAGSSSDIAVLQTDVRDLKEARFNDNGRMVRMETLLKEILEEVKASR